MINPILNKFKKRENIFFYFGGAGDLSKFYKLILQFCIMNQVFKKKFNVDLVIGPMAYNYSRIKSLKKRFKFLNIVSNKFDLSEYEANITRNLTTKISNELIIKIIDL